MPNFRRYPLTALFLILNLSILISGTEHKYWPLMNYTMFARVDRMFQWPMYTVSAENADGSVSDWEHIRGAFRPYSIRYGIYLVINSYEWPVACGFLRTALDRLGPGRTLIVSRKMEANQDWVPYARVSKESGCVLAH